MLCPSISRWNFQRSSIGKLPKMVCCLIVDCSTTSSTLPARTPASSRSRSRSRAHSSAAGTVDSQSTMLPIMLKRYASNAPIAAVSSVVASSHGRTPFEHSHRKAKKARGGVTGAASG